MLFIGGQPLGIPNDQLRYHWNDMLPRNTQRRRLIINASLSLHPCSPRGPISAKSSHSFKKPIIFLTRSFLLRQNRQVKKGGIVGNPPPENTCHASHGDTWHAYHLDHPHPNTHDALLLSGLPQGKANDTYKHKHPDDFHKYIRMTNIGRPDMIVRVIDWRKASLTRYHNSLPWPTFRHLQSEGTRWSDNKSLPTIISHDHLPRSLTAASPITISIKPPVGWWWPCHHLGSSWQHKISSHH